MESVLELNRQKYINNLSKAISVEMKSMAMSQQQETQIQQLPTKMLARQLMIQTQLNATSSDLAFRRQIIPQTRGSTKKVVYGM
jgi:hypothetical protein